MDLEELYDKLLRYCYSKTHDKYLAEDIVQDTFVRFYSNHTYKETGKQLAYMYTIARNLCMDHYRKPVTVDIETAGPDVERALGQVNDMNELMDYIDVEQALEKLDESERELVILRYNQGLSAADIGEIVGMSRWAVYRKIKRILKLMREELEGGSGHDR